LMRERRHPFLARLFISVSLLGEKAITPTSCSPPCASLSADTWRRKRRQKQSWSENTDEKRDQGPGGRRRGHQRQGVGDRPKRGPSIPLWSSDDRRDHGACG